MTDRATDHTADAEPPKEAVAVARYFARREAALVARVETLRSERDEACEEVARLKGLRAKAAQMPWSFHRGSLRFGGGDVTGLSREREAEIREALTHEGAFVYRTDALDLLAGLDEARQERDALRAIAHAAKASLSANGRSYAQRALIEACRLTGGDPYDWTEHPDVVDAVLAASPELTLSEWLRLAPRVNLAVSRPATPTEGSTE